MRLGGQRRSSNIEDRRGLRAATGGGLGLGAVAIVVIASLLFGVDPGPILGMLSGAEGPGGAPQQQQGVRGAPADAAGGFIADVLGSTEDAWTALFAQGAMPGAPRSYAPPTLVLFTDATPSACGLGQAAMGPFYCPRDQQVFLDTAFFADLDSRFGAPGDFAQAYVIAHEVAHHVQTLSGVSAEVRRAQAAADQRAANALQVRMELQADCLAGVWGGRAAAAGLLEAGDLEEALGAAAAIGDDRLQRQAQGRVTPDSFTHGSSAQRTRWFQRGFESGDPAQCDTFAARAL